MATANFTPKAVEVKKSLHKINALGKVSKRGVIIVEPADFETQMAAYDRNTRPIKTLRELAEEYLVGLGYGLGTFALVWEEPKTPHMWGAVGAFHVKNVDLLEDITLKYTIEK